MPSSGIVLRTTRSGFHYACYFDEANDFPSLWSALNATCGDLIQDHVVNVVIKLDYELYGTLKEICDKNDCGTVEILEQYE